MSHSVLGRGVDTGCPGDDVSVGAALTKDLLEAIEVLKRGVTFEVKCLVKVPVIEEEVGVILAHIERRATSALVCPELLILRFYILVLAVRRQEDLLTRMRRPVHLDQHSHEAFVFGEVYEPLFVEVRNLIGELLDIGKVDVEEVLYIEITLTSDCV